MEDKKDQIVAMFRYGRTIHEIYVVTGVSREIIEQTLKDHNLLVIKN
jgi:hypothetical protein